MEHAEGSEASKSNAWTAGGLRTAGDLTLPPVQLELFTDAGAVLAERALHAGATRETVAGILRRSAKQAEALLAGTVGMP